jgi:hypothetical protein
VFIDQSSAFLPPEFNALQRTADTERGAELRTRIELLERLIEAYQNNELHQSSMDSSWPAESLP